MKAGNKNNLKIYLKESSIALNEIVVVGYGSQSEKLVTTSISSLKVDDLDQGSDYNVAKMLQGRTPGVNVASASGTPGEQPSVRVRGIASITGNSTPLYVVDGVPSESMPMLNPNDIERMDVLKDASAAAIYGSRANNGVVIITTKSGNTNSKTRVNASVRHSLGWIANDIPMANVAEYTRTMQAAVDNWNVQKKDTKSFFIPDRITETDWLGLIQRDIAHSTTASINLSGGNEKTTFFTSVGFNDQQGIIRTSGFQQTNLRAKFTHQLNKWFKLNLNLTGSYSRFDKVEESSTSLKVIRTAREEQPWIGAYREDGGYTVMSTELCRHNPVMLINEEDWTVHKKQGVAALSFDITPIKGLKYTPSFSIYGILDEEKKTISEKHDARSKNAGWGALSEQKNVSYRYVIDNVISYENSWDKLTYSAMLGHSYEEYNYETFGAYSDNYANGAYPSSSFGLINSGSNIYAGSIGYNAYALESYFGRAALNWDNRYILNVTMRRDGSSRFSKKNRWSNFPSVSLAWRLSEEPFFKKSFWLSDVKLRAGYGLTGNQASVGNYAYASTIQTIQYNFNGTQVNAIAPSVMPNPNVRWEEVEQYNVGADLTMIDGRINLSLDAYIKNTNDMLVDMVVPISTGYSDINVPKINAGKMRNKGFEVSVSSRNLVGEFSWNTSLNASYNKNEIIRLNGDVPMYFDNNIHAVGHPVSSFYGYVTNGIFQTQEEVDRYAIQTQGNDPYNRTSAGDIKFKDLNNDGIINDKDRTYLGSPTPTWIFSMNNSFAWKGFDLEIFLQGAAGNKIYNANRASLEAMSVAQNQMTTVLDRWRGEGTSNSMPRAVFGDPNKNGRVSNRFIEDGKYLRLKNVTLGYTLPAAWSKKAAMSSVRFFVSGQNLLTLTRYTGLDPEISGSGNDNNVYPIARNITFGASVSF